MFKKINEVYWHPLIQDMQWPVKFLNKKNLFQKENLCVESSRNSVSVEEISSDFFNQLDNIHIRKRKSHIAGTVLNNNQG